MNKNLVPRVGLSVGVAGLMIMGSGAPSFADLGVDQDRSANLVITADHDGDDNDSDNDDSDHDDQVGQMPAGGADTGVPAAGNTGNGNDNDSDGDDSDHDDDNDSDNDDDDSDHDDDQVGQMPAGGADTGVPADHDDNDSDGDDSDHDDQVAPMPAGGADTGIGGTPVEVSYVSDGTALALAGGTALALAGGGMVWLRNRRVGQAD